MNDFFPNLTSPDPYLISFWPAVPRQTEFKVCDFRLWRAASAGQWKGESSCVTIAVQRLKGYWNKPKVPAPEHCVMAGLQPADSGVDHASSRVLIR